ncbi:ricin-type beta-trefoil lectin domain protein [Nonomuraea sp. SMC257]|uniref:Ricin-type beta-trefoil lectin domain protein n=1 Tax=Nonomuraea montanisoli TaxID=2741721 RepID=A0A7Y6IDH1_9ACTN|nr:RICIN domain-containing protein [Nonomuraea montanisoli]NUW35618.1 ricin-type beta-trefoil lectin domain protein [Nonomuraea montanisoli]
MAAGLAAGLTVVTHPAPAAAAGGHATDWMNQRKWGVMTHYLAEGCPPGCRYGSYATGQWPTVTEWNHRVDNYDIAGVVNQLKSVGAGWLQFTVGQVSGYWAAPNPVYESLVPATAEHPSRLSNRDLVKDLATAAHAAGLKFIVYVPLDAPRIDTYATTKLGGDPDADFGGVRNAAFQNNWTKVIKQWSQQWGTLIDGWWIDGGIPSIDEYASNIVDAARSGNPSTLIGLSAAGWHLSTNPNSAAKSDFVSGEDKLSASSRWVDYNGTQVLTHGLSRLQGHWGNPADTAMSHNTENLVNSTLSFMNAGGAMTWDVGYDWATGRISDQAMRQLAVVAESTGTTGGDGIRTDSSQPSITYNGTWDTVTDPRYADGSARVSTGTGNSASFTFNGTSVKWVGGRSSGAGKAEVRIDGTVQAGVDLASSPTTGDDVVFAKHGLSNGPHTITITPTTSGAVAVDAFEAGNQARINVDDSDTSLHYSGFSSGNPGGCFNNTCHNSNTAGSTATYWFTGSRITWNAITGPDQGSAAVSIDNGPATIIGLADESRSVDVPAYISPALPYGPHTIKITTQDAKWVTVDRFAIDTVPTKIVGVASGRCVDVSNSQDGTDLNLRTCNGTNAQKWATNPANGEVRALGKCMDVEQGNQADGTPVQLYSCNGSAAQKWTYDAGTKQLKAFGKCLDALGAGTTDGTKLVIWPCHSGTNQQWQIGG